MLRVGSCQISLTAIGSPEEYWYRMASILKSAQDQGCRVFLLPEYACLSLLVYGHEERVSFQDRLKDFALKGYKSYEARLMDLSKTYSMHLVGGTYPVFETFGKMVNRCPIVRMGMPFLFQDKLNMTRFEDEVWAISAPEESLLKIFYLDGVRTAVAVCYDVEFPSLTAAAAAAQVELLLVPSCTDNVHGYWRVRHCAQARTVENQCFVAMSSVVEGDPRFSEMDFHEGQGGIFSPCDGFFPERGILAEGNRNQEGFCWADLNLERV